MPLQTDSHTRSPISRQRIVEDVIRIVAEEMGMNAETIQETSHLTNDLGCDSLDIVEIAMEVEEHFDISIPDDVEQDAHTVGKIADGVMRLLAGEQSS